DMTPTAPHAQTRPGLTGRMRVLLALVLTGQFMAVLDASIVNVAIPTIRVDLRASGSDLQLIVAGYVIAYAVLLITGARLGMRFGFRTAFLRGLALFTAAFFACGVAPTSQVLVGVRAIQGAGAALIVPLVLGHEQGWPAWTFGSLALSVVAIIVFARIERSVERRGGAPLISERILRAPGMPAALIAIVLALAAYGGFLFTFTQHLQGGLHDSALQAGITFVPLATGFALSSLNWRRLPVRWHQLVIPAGCFIAA